jgi:hypothetical protein
VGVVVGNKWFVLVIVLLFFLSINVDFSSSKNDAIFTSNPLITTLDVRSYNSSISNTQNEEIIVVKSEGFFSRLFSKIFSSSRNLITGFTTGGEIENENQSLASEKDYEDVQNLENFGNNVDTYVLGIDSNIFTSYDDEVIFQENVTYLIEEKIVYENNVSINETELVYENNETEIIIEEIYKSFAENKTQEEIILTSENNYENTTNLENISGDVNTEVITMDSSLFFLENVSEIVKTKKFQIYDSKNQKVNAEIKIENLTNGLNRIKVKPENSRIKEIDFNNVSLKKDLNNLKFEDFPEFNNFINTYSIDPSGLNFTEAIVTVVAKGNVLYKCKDWNYTSQQCFGEWKIFKTDLIPGQEYSFILTPEDPAFGEIYITNAIHLDRNRIFLEDIYDLVYERDYIYASISNNEYIRITFEEELDFTKDITIYAKSSNNGKVEVYEKDSDIKIADFGTIFSDGKYKILLTSLIGKQNTFDLKVVGGTVDFDYIFDPPAVVVNFTSSGSWTVPTNVNKIIVEAWGGGGAGGGVAGGGTTGGRGGGGGGAYARKNISVTPGQNYNIVIGAGGTGTSAAGNPGGDTTFNSTLVVAKGGSGGSATTTGGAGGSATNSVGDVKYAGGTGGNGVGTTSSGGGGGGAGSTGAGGSASGITAGTGTSLLGGTGGTGRTTASNAGNIGNVYGGAGSGALKTSGGTAVNGGAGRQGYLRITYILQTPPTVTLVSPTNNAITTRNVNFTCSAVNASPGRRLTNITFYWNHTGTLIANGTVSVSGISNSTTFQRTNLGVRNIAWNCYVCDNASECGFASTSYTLFANVAPTHTTPILNSTFGTNGDNENLTCYNQSTYDFDGDVVKNIFGWRKNNIPIFLLNMPFEGGSNSTYTKDYSNSRHATGYNFLSTSWSKTSGYDGFGSYKFTRASNTRLVVPDFDYPENFTISLWFKNPPLTGTAFDYFYSHGTWGQKNSIRIYFVESTNNIVTSLWANNDTVEMSFNNASYSNNAWHHYALVVSKTSGVKLYIDNVLIGQNSTAGKGGITPSTNLFLGHRSDLGTDRAYNGSLDELKIFNTALTTEQINLIYSSNYNKIHSSLTSNQDTWQCRITPNDRYVDGTLLISNSVIIGATNDINILSPEELNYNYSNVLVNISATGDDIDTVWFNWNGTNVTYTTPVYVNFTDGEINLYAYVNNTLGNITSTFVTFTVDTTAPIINIISPESRNYYSSNILIDISATDLNLNKVWYNYNGTNTTYISSTIKSFSVGNYTLHAWANDSFGRLSYKNVSFQVLDTVYNGVPYCIDAISPCVAESSLLKCRDTVSDGNGPEPNQPNTLDGCTDGTSVFSVPSCGNDESVENITITSMNDTKFRKNDWVQVKATVHCYGEFNYEGLIYTNNASNPSWSVKQTDNTECAVSGYREVVFEPIQLSDVVGDHAVRVYIVYDPDGANLSQTCGRRTNLTANRYDDNDDVVFKVLNEKIILNIISPMNTTYNTSTILVNISASNPVLDSVWFNWNGTNITYTTPINVTFPDGQYTLIAYANDTYGNIESKNVTFIVDTFTPLLAFTVTLPGQAPVNANSDGNQTAIMNFYSLSNTYYNMNPCVGSSSDCQNETIPFFVYTNTGNINLTLNVYLNSTLPNMFELKANTAYNSTTASIVNTSNLLVGSNILPTNTLDLWFFGSFINAYPNDSTNRTLISNGTQS